MKPKVTAERLREVLEYDPDTGIFRWRLRHGRMTAGDAAGSTHRKTGYRVIKIDKVQYLEHRIVWLWMNGRWPEEEIDHRDGDRTNNRLENLREATPSQNQASKRRQRQAVVGLKGVCRDRAHGRHTGKFRAAIRTKGKRTYLGSFNTPEEAHAAYCAAAAERHGEYARFN